MKRAYVDTDIIFDLFLERKPYYESAFVTFQLAEDGKIDLYISSLCFTNLYYVMKKKLPRKEVIDYLKKLNSMVNVLAVDGHIVNCAIESDFNDFEDAVQYFTAKENKIDILLTRNTRDFKVKDISIMTADEFLRIL
jgi:predicted nucleic acid-binding protein